MNTNNTNNKNTSNNSNSIVNSLPVLNANEVSSAPQPPIENTTFPSTQSTNNESNFGKISTSIPIIEAPKPNPALASSIPNNNVTNTQNINQKANEGNSLTKPDNMHIPSLSDALSTSTSSKVPNQNPAKVNNTSSINTKNEQKTKSELTKPDNMHIPSLSDALSGSVSNPPLSPQNIVQTNNQINSQNEGKVEGENLENNSKLNEEKMMQLEQSYAINDDELLREYVGDNYEKIIKGKFNLPAFFLSSFYLFYRKRFLYGILFFFIQYVISVYIKIYYLNIVANILLGLFANKLYIYSAKKHIKRIKKKYKNSNVEYIKEMCISKGGTSILKSILGFFAIIVLFFAITIISIIYGLELAFEGLNKIDFNSIFNVTIIDEDDSKYEGSLSFFKTVEIQNEFSMDLLNGFIDNSNVYSYEYDYIDDNSSFGGCNATLFSPLGFKKPDRLLSQIKKYHSDDISTRVTKIKINDINWYWLKLTNNDREIYYYATEKDGKVFVFRYNIDNYSMNNCSIYRQDILNSIKSL